MVATRPWGSCSDSTQFIFTQMPRRSCRPSGLTARMSAFCLRFYATAITIAVLSSDGRATTVPTENKSFDKIADSVQDLVKIFADCRTSESVLKVAEVLSSQQTTLSKFLSTTAHKSPPQCVPTSLDLASRVDELGTKLEEVRKWATQMEERLLQVETTSSQAKERSQDNEGKLHQMQESASKSSCRSPFYRVGDDCVYVDTSLRLPWSQCRNFCQGFGGDLAVPSDITKLREFIIRFNKRGRHLVGSHYRLLTLSHLIVFYNKHGITVLLSPPPIHKM
ncbi:uncharacterized protein LOC143036741 isoform X2 [Oratosquilla oratoria]|uniref:uncharacterized protein LOC143036741 isoform X2 n=1 Tax=Oratosquilla oratoria TaxID=337810 RepID=UPI003F75D659